MNLRRTFVITVLALALGAVAAIAQRDFSKVEIKTTKVAEGVWMLQGAGGNIGVCAGEDGVLLIDDQFAPLTERIEAAIAEFSDEPLRFVFNTHFHGDHVGGNQNLADLGATIVAHANVRRRMSSEQVNQIFGSKTPPSAPDALPMMTFGDSLSFHLNGQDIVCVHVAPAHTDGDAIVWFPRANVIHAGDCLFNGGYPVIDVSAGGGIDGMIAASETLLAMAGPDTKIIPGHGPLATRADVQAFHDMLVTARDRVKKLLAEKQTLEQIQAAKPLADLDATWGQSFMKQDVFLKELVLSLAR
jgi:glyoxylase-like metal-dependent hydrolase (beta-lactamase superfamily II)